MVEGLQPETGVTDLTSVLSGVRMCVLTYWEPLVSFFDFRRRVPIRVSNSGSGPGSTTMLPTNLQPPGDRRVGERPVGTPSVIKSLVVVGTEVALDQRGLVST